MEEEALANKGAQEDVKVTAPASVVSERSSLAAPRSLDDHTGGRGTSSKLSSDAYPPPRLSSHVAPTWAGFSQHAGHMPDGSMPTDMDVFGTPPVGKVGKHKVGLEFCHEVTRKIEGERPGATRSDHKVV
jgi:hypothetical protein